MGILNITPDSFSDNIRLYEDNKHNIDAILNKAEEMIQSGADIIDIGGESTRPGALEVDADEEMNRVLPAIEILKSHFDVTISLDTYKADTALEGIKAGADIINDVSMLQDCKMTDVLAKSQVKYILTHNHESYVNLSEELFKAAGKLIQSGIDRRRIILDPGIGFKKSNEDNIREVKNISELCKLEFPVILGISNKSLIGNILDLPINERLEGTIALNLYGVMNGVSILRVHDVKANVRAVKMLEAVIYG